ncbi:MAG: preprotein translocase subunit SecE [Syntrophales bacterium]|nr:preprotein translocase subunit SecE [Syntrophales bacterium]
MEKIRNAWEVSVQFLREARSELKKVTWPTPKQALASTSVVIVVVLIVSLYLGLIDMVLTRMVRLVLG